MRFLKILPLLFLSVIFLSLKQDNTQTIAKIKWHSLTEAQALMKEEPKKLFVDLYTDWCGWCKVMDKNTFKNEVVVELMNQHFYAVKFNAEKEDSLQFNGKAYKLRNRGNGRFLHQWAREFGATQRGLSYPTTIYFTENLQKIQTIPGYHDAHTMEKILEFLGGDYGRKGITYPQFESQYQSRVPKPKEQKKPKGH